MRRRAADLRRGRALYGRHCATCHGTTGAGDGPGARYLAPAPAKLAEHAYATARLADVLWHGVAGSAMPAWRDYSTDDRAALALAVQALSPRGRHPPTSRDARREVYAANCAQCHGVDGDGRGSAAAASMAPASFTAQQLSLEAVRAARGARIARHKWTTASRCRTPCRGARPQPVSRGAAHMVGR
jgi:mono/diheme cytochrome c family protein